MSESKSERASERERKRERKRKRERERERERAPMLLSVAAHVSVTLAHAQKHRARSVSDPQMIEYTKSHLSACR